MYVEVVVDAAGRRELFVLHDHVPSRNDIDEKFGIEEIGIGVASMVWATPAQGMVIIALAHNKKSVLINSILLSLLKKSRDTRTSESAPFWAHYTPARWSQRPLNETRFLALKRDRGGRNTSKDDGLGALKGRPRASRTSFVPPSSD